jgi:hypothetical protein
MYLLSTSLCYAIFILYYAMHFSFREKHCIARNIGAGHCVKVGLFVFHVFARSAARAVRRQQCCPFSSYFRFACKSRGDKGDCAKKENFSKKNTWNVNAARSVLSRGSGVDRNFNWWGEMLPRKIANFCTKKNYFYFSTKYVIVFNISTFLGWPDMISRISSGITGISRFRLIFYTNLK